MGIQGAYNLEQLVPLLELLEQHAHLCVIVGARQDAHLALELLHFQGGKKARKGPIIQSAAMRR